MVQDRRQLVNPSTLPKALSVLANASTVGRVALSACLGFCVVLGTTETQAQSLGYGTYVGEGGEGASYNRESSDINATYPGGSDSQSPSSEADKSSAQLNTGIYTESLFDLSKEDIYDLINAVTESFSDEDFDDLRRLIQNNRECRFVQELDPNGKRNLGAYINAQCRRYIGRKTASLLLRAKIRDFIVEKLKEAGARDQEQLEQVAEQMASILEEHLRAVIVDVNENTDLKYLWELIYSPIK